MFPEHQRLAIAKFLNLLPKSYSIHEEYIDSPLWYSEPFWRVIIKYSNGLTLIENKKIEDINSDKINLLYVLNFLPNYLCSLDEMHEVEKHIPDEKYVDLTSVIYEDFSYVGWLNRIVSRDTPLESTGKVRYYSPSAAQRAEAFLKCLNLWTDG